MGLTERHYFEDEEPELTEQQLEDSIDELQKAYMKGFSDCWHQQQNNSQIPAIASCCPYCGKPYSVYFDNGFPYYGCEACSKTVTSSGAGAPLSPQGEGLTRLLTLEEARNAVGHGWEEVWFEADPEEGEAEYKECFECVFIYGHIRAADGDIGEVNEETYNRRHHSRLWLGEDRPTDEQREAAMWDDHHHDHGRAARGVL